MDCIDKELDPIIDETELAFLHNFTLKSCQNKKNQAIPKLKVFLNPDFPKGAKNCRIKRSLYDIALQAFFSKTGRKALKKENFRMCLIRAHKKVIRCLIWNKNPTGRMLKFDVHNKNFARNWRQMANVYIKHQK